MALRPLRDYLLVRESAPVSPAGIHFLRPPVDPGLVKELVYGEVLALGPGRPREGMWGLQVGDRIAYSPVLQTKTPEGTLVRLGSVVGTLS